ncbi:hypothetical protein COV04_02535 [Candidatus Uhrbacteria bacterium CG10_big_fil_rev_8_21_14_0_10_48_11]|uniref:O-antigen ligase-related domain-containing protein n=1 Tax=Candidatus Uhrbacteria bacterium CG10_big_fil_rev_8_21_14_0_10_48_11 TaxID=1975037 RepID=A0A2M8LEC1_9BACT|nr:MAG: hypothetical protein COV04_02535 [Candidatus Uhrbacteria bacterium CG10_big_fil_rev_8_21_14_0_10_48_11]
MTITRALFPEQMTTRVWLPLFVLVDVLSFFAYFEPSFRTAFFVILFVAYVILALTNYKYAVLVAFAELFVGSHGYLLWLQLGETQVSMRIAFYLLLMAASVLHVKELRLQLSKPSGKALLAVMGPLAFFIGLAFVRGVLSGANFGAVFFDANAYLYFALVVPLLVVIADKDFFKDCVHLLFVAAGYLAVKTVLLFYVFTHSYFQYFVPDIYMWLRDSKIGEFTPLGTGLYRIFIQSQIYLLVVWIYAVLSHVHRPVWHYGKAVLYVSFLAAALIVSYSRSFWLGWVGVLMLAVVWLLASRRMVEAIRSVGFSALSVLIGYLVVVAVVAVPFPGTPSGAKFSLDERLTASDAAASSRWNELSPLWKQIEKHQFIGNGFGSSVTYISNDPRVREENSSGLYITTAFEWGYLDMWLKLGLLGIASYGLLISCIIYWGYQKKVTELGLLFGVLAVLMVNIGSPYLNHPLGIGLVLLALLFYAPGLTGSENRAINMGSTLPNVPR